MQLTAYNVKTKTKGVPIQDAVIKVNSKGRHVVTGHDGCGNKMAAIVSGESARAAIEAGTAKLIEG